MGDRVSVVRVEEAEDGRKLLDFVRRRAGKDVPQGAVMRWIRTGQVRVDGRRAKPYDRLAAGQNVRLPPYRPGEKAEAGRMAAMEAPAVPPPTVYEDDEVLVLAKPAGLPVHPGTGHADSVHTRLAAAFADAAFIPAPVHRLDKDTSGLLVAAKTRRAANEAAQAFRDGRVDKDYLAWVAGEWTRSAVGQAYAMRDSLAKSGPAGRERMHAGMDADVGCQALAEAVPLMVTRERSLLVVRLLTGRTHQIRVQLASRGHPVLGDRKYGGPGYGGTGLLLHCWRLALLGREWVLPPPWTGEDAVPDDLLRHMARGRTKNAAGPARSPVTTKSGSRS
ncbi:RluA family pseudouridine synthase [Desulfolutivibrio sulfoxidireducens]|uniref:RluA family pseudouridine synthase n=1 Tax=Desulfolutivibrio sulfoxidireducens TaxID=2773299 RepID=UPI00159D1BC9|nr:RluA family pseudouridine synthase [Desulfolutivibrio sulfoxidireducens]QLA19502.1 RluA family pseudouridine synthase [Desulfolutivibrio sulfoxidireducens]